MNDELPNGLTRAEVEARPDVFVGMVGFDVGTWFGSDPSWFRASRLDVRIAREDFWGHVLLPGEPGCPWPPPPEFRREWVEGDRAWVLCDPGEKWRRAIVRRDDGELWFRFSSIGPCRALGWLAIGTPALWVPGVEG